MKTRVRVLLGCSLVLFSVLQAAGQLAQTCQTCFTSSVVSAVPSGNQCTDYKIEVSYSGRCEHALSHFTVALPECGKLSNLSNSEHWQQVIGYDPTTGLTGFKINSTSNFGGFGCAPKFLVTFTLCSKASCSLPACWKPVVAYKAGNCFERDTLDASCVNLLAHMETKDPSCFASQDGQLTVVVDQGQAPFQYNWSTGATSASIQSVGAGTYSVIVHDASGSQVNLSGTLSSPDSLSVTSTITNASCPGKSNGSIVLAVSGGSGGPYTYLWNNSATTRDLDSLAAGTYHVTVTDSSGCSRQATINVGNQQQITVSAVITPPGCSQSNGAISATATGGTPPYQYLWSNGSTQQNLTELHGGTYTITVTDAGGCSTTSSYFLRELNTLSISYLVKPTRCLDDGSGAIDVSVAGGIPPYHYTWSNGDSTQDVDGLTAGLYTVTVTDSTGCQRATRISVFRQTFNVNSQVTQPKCFGESTGSISLSPSGGVSPYQFLWTNGSTSSTLDGLASGTYTVTVTDSTGCSRQLVFVIAAPAALTAAPVITSLSCSEHLIALSVTGGTQPYQYLWSTGSTNPSIQVSGAGTVSVTVTDNNGCTTQQSISVDSTSSVACLITPLSTSPTCNSLNNRLATSVTDADTYLWAITSSDGSWTIQSGAQADSIVFTAGNTNTSATFTLTISKNGCSQTCSYLVTGCTSGGSGGDGTNNESCADCFSSTITQVSSDGYCAKFKVNISTDGNCRYDLSHVVIAIPCGQISDYSTTSHWPLVLGKDPTTGLTGLKVDNVSNFGKVEDSFIVEFTVCGTADCADQLEHWNPVVAYKAGQCIAYDTLSVKNGGSASCGYPNPFHNSINFDVEADHDDNVTVEIYDQRGNRVAENSETWMLKGEKKTISIEGSGLGENLYYFRVRCGTNVMTGKLLKGR